MTKPNVSTAKKAIESVTQAKTFSELLSVIGKSFKKPNEKENLPLSKDKNPNLI